MKKITKQFQDATAHVVLSRDDKALMRERLVQYMEYKPIRTAQLKQTPVNRIAVPVLSFFKAKHISGALIIALVVTSGTYGVSSAATEALPGDFLYPVKVNINEEVKGALLSSDEARAAWEQERAERRLTEASQLAAEGRLDAAKQQKVAELFTQHTEAVVEQARKMEQNDPVMAAELSDELEQSLDTHEAVLARLLVEKDGDTNVGAVSLVEQVKSVALEASKIRASAETMIGDDIEEVPATELATGTAEIVAVTAQSVATDDATRETRERAADRAETRANEHLEEANGELAALDAGSELAERVSKQINAGRELMERATQERGEGMLKRAYQSFRSASGMFQQVAQLARATQKFDVPVTIPEPAVSENTEPELATTTESEEEIPVSEEEGAPEATTTDTTDSLYSAASTTIAQVQALLVSGGDYDATMLEQATASVKDATASFMRADVARGLGDEEGARTLYVLAQSQAEVAIRTLAATSANETVETGEPTDSGQSATSAEPFALMHSYEEEGSVHVYTGTIDLPTPCHILSTQGSTSDAAPGEITLMITVTPPAEGDAVCVQMIDSRTFEIRVTAPVDATTTRIVLNGEETPFAIHEGNVVEETTVVPAEQSVASTSQGNSEAPGLLRRAFESTANMFR